MKCKPLTMADLVGGQLYLQVVVSMDGDMRVEPFTFCGRPRKRTLLLGKKEYDWWFDVRRPVEGEIVPRGVEYSATDLGLEPSARYNFHRVFRHTAKNQRILSDLIERKDLEGYWKLIGTDLIEAKKQHASNKEHLEIMEELEEESKDFAFAGE